MPRVKLTKNSIDSLPTSASDAIYWDAGCPGFGVKVTATCGGMPKVSPHMFRTSGASAAATHGGENPFLASALLHHTHPSVTNAHYNRATSLSAAESLRQIVRQYEK